MLTTNTGDGASGEGTSACVRAEFKRSGGFGKAPAARVKRGEIFMAGGEGGRGAKGGFDKVRQICTKLDKVRK